MGFALTFAVALAVLSRTSVVAAAPGPCGTSLSPSPPTGITHVIWIVMENHAYNQIIGSSSAPYENQLAAQCGLATNYTAITHPSLPNYIAMTSGGTQGITDDNPPSSHPLGVASIFSQVKAAGKTWRAYEEAMPGKCASTSSGRYAVKHNPPPYYTGIAADCANWDVPLGTTSSGNLAGDLNAGMLPAFSFITPDMCNDTHDCSVATGDSWLQSWVTRITASSSYQSGSVALFITWDEDDSANGNHIATFVVSPYTPTAYRSSTSYNHYSLLRTAEQLLNISTYLGNASGARPMLNDFFTSSASPPSVVVLPAISGSVQVGQTLSASTGSWSGSPSSYAYQWSVCDSAGAGCVAIVGATASLYPLTSAEVGHTLRVRVTASNSVGSGSATSAATAVVAAAPASAYLFGKRTVGAAFYAMSADYKRSSAFVLSQAATVKDLVASIDGGGATSGSQQMRFAIYADSGGVPGALLAQTNVGTVAAGAAPAWLDLPLVSPRALTPGTYHLAILSGSTTKVARYSRDAQTNGLHSGADAFADGASNPYGSATTDNYQIAIYAAGSVSSASPPSVVVLPAISGSVQVGQTLSASTGSWSGSPSSYAYQWSVCDSAGAGCVALVGATASLYRLTSAEVGHTLRVRVTASNSVGSGSATSAATAVVAAAPASAYLFGKRTVGAAFYAMSADYKRSSAFVLSQAATVKDLVASIDGGGATSGSQQMRFAIYADSGGVPGALLAQTNVGTVAAGAAPAWLDLPLVSPRALTPGTYHLAILSGSTTKVARYSRDVQTNGLHSGADAFADGASNPYGSATTDNYQIAIYAAGTSG